MWDMNCIYVTNVILFWKLPVRCCTLPSKLEILEIPKSCLKSLTKISGNKKAYRASKEWQTTSNVGFSEWKLHVVVCRQHLFTAYMLKWKWIEVQKTWFESNRICHHVKILMLEYLLVFLNYYLILFDKEICR